MPLGNHAGFGSGSGIVFIACGGPFQAAYMSTEEIIGIAAGICTATSLLPQVIKTIKTKEAEEVSFKMLLTLLAGLILWIIYGWMKKDLPILVTNCFSLLLNLAMIFLRIRYGKREG